MKMKNSLVTVLIALLFSVMANAQERFVVITGDAPVYEDSNGSGVCLNQFDEDVVLQPGMLMKVIDQTSDKTKIQYATGGQGWISNTSTTSPNQTQEAEPGTYEVINADGISVTISPDLKCEFMGEKLSGQRVGGAIVFLNQFGDPVLSVVMMPDGKTYVYTYDNQFTCFI